MSCELLPSMHGHGILRERFAEIATDAYRSQMLEAFGYQSKVMEFIDLAHTARNLLIKAIRTPKAAPDARLRAKADEIVVQLGIHAPQLAILIDGEPQFSEQD